jgi:hypothetical protein
MDLKGFSETSIDALAPIGRAILFIDILPLHHFHTLEAVYAVWDQL